MKKVLIAIVLIVILASVGYVVYSKLNGATEDQLVEFEKAVISAGSDFFEGLSESKLEAHKASFVANLTKKEAEWMISIMKSNESSWSEEDKQETFRLIDKIRAGL